MRVLVYVDSFTRNLVVSVLGAQASVTEMPSAPLTATSSGDLFNCQLDYDSIQSNSSLDFVHNYYPGQGNDGWRNFARFLPSASLIAAQPLAVKVRLIADRWWQLCFKSEPRWRAGRWKAKT